jgi:hypothetical protein
MAYFWLTPPAREVWPGGRFFAADETAESGKTPFAAGVLTAY